MKKINAARVIALFGCAISASPVVAQETDWTGAYATIQGGYSYQRGDKDEIVVFDTNLDGNFNDTVRTVAGADAFSPGFCSGRGIGPTPANDCADDSDGIEVGVRVGYDWQTEGNLVFGVVGSYTRSGMTDGVTAFSTTPANYVFSRTLRNLFSARVRGGYAFDDVLVYATGGGNYGTIRNRFRSTNTANDFVIQDDNGSFGYELGGGIEHRVSERFTLGVQYLYRELTDDDYVVRAAPGRAGPTNPFLLVDPRGTDMARSRSNFDSSAIEVSVGYRF